MGRYFYSRNKPKHSNRKTNLMAIITLLAILSGILLYFTGEKQNERILRSYCGDFGIYGKYLILMNDSSFRFSYHGCSQINGYVSGRWNSDGDDLTLTLDQPDDNLDSQYELNNTELVPITSSFSEKFILCEYYKAPWERTEQAEIPLVSNEFE